MSIGIVGVKVGMTQVYAEDGAVVPVTVIRAPNLRVVQIKTDETDGYNAVQVTVGSCKPTRLTKPLAGHYAKANVIAGRGLWEFRVDSQEQLGNYQLGAEISSADIFTVGSLVDVTGTSKGKGFAGGVKRHNFRTQDASHGNSVSHRAPGSIGQNQTPGRVFKGKKMAGHLGNVKCTVQNQKVVQVDAQRQLILVKGVVPGAPGSDVIIKPAIKSRAKGEKK